MVILCKEKERVTAAEREKKSAGEMKPGAGKEDKRRNGI